MLKFANIASFQDEMEKMALVTSTMIDRGTPVMGSVTELEKKLRPGDIVLTKASLGKKDFVTKTISAIQKLRSGDKKAPSEWTHASLYMGDGKLRHAYTGVQGGQAGKGTAKVRDHSLGNLANAVGRDLLILRPNVSKEESAKAVKRSRVFLGRKYDTLAALRAGAWKKKKSKDETIIDKLPAKTICTGLIGYAYPQIQFSKKNSIFTLLPSEIGANDKLKQIAAYSRDNTDRRPKLRLPGVKI